MPFIAARPWLMIAVALVLFHFGDAVGGVQAQTAEAMGDCLLKIDGKIFEARPCDMDHDDGGVIMFGHLDEKNYAGYWVYLIDNKDGSFSGYWNDEYGAARAHSTLGVLKREDLGVGECFSSDKALLCRNIPADTPVYYVENRDADQGGNVLLAYLNGVEYQLSHPAWDILTPVEVMDRVDIDGDGRLDTLVSVTTGGNCCADSISIASYRGDGFFTFLDETPLTGGWGGHEVVKEQGHQVIRINDTPTGYGNQDAHRGQRDYAFVNGHMELIAERTEHSAASEIAGLGLDEVKFEDGGRKTLTFDINNDATQDEVSCTYWERWGILNCKAMISGVEKPVELQCNHVSVSPVVYGIKRSHRLICDGNIVEY